MFCVDCYNRRQKAKMQICDAYRQSGMSGAAKAVRQVGRDILKKPPKFLKRNGKPVNG